MLARFFGCFAKLTMRIPSALRMADCALLRGCLVQCLRRSDSLFCSLIEEMTREWRKWKVKWENWGTSRYWLLFVQWKLHVQFAGYGSRLCPARRTSNIKDGAPYISSIIRWGLERMGSRIRGSELVWKLFSRLGIELAGSAVFLCW